MKISNTLRINAPIEAVWKITAHDFAKIGEWSSSIQQSVINKVAPLINASQVGGRVCIVPGYGNIHERFTAYDEEQKTFTYEASGLPFFILSAHNTWYMHPIDANTTEVSFQAEIKFIPLLGILLSIPMRIRLHFTVGIVLEELKHYLETGQIHPRKVNQIAIMKPPVQV